MNISSINNIKSIPFSARKKEIRDADDIQRKARQTFPMMSPTYMDEYCRVTKLDENNNPVNLKARKLYKSIDRKISVLRKLRENPQEFYVENNNGTKDSIPYVETLDAIKYLKAGNCEECTVAALAALYANGYYNSEKNVLGLQTEYVNKETGKIEYRNTDNIDHCFVVTTLDKKMPKENDKIVVDAWLGFADSKSGAIAKYKEIYDEEKLHDITSFNRSMFRVAMAEKTGKLIDFNDYELRQNFVFTPNNRLTRKQKEDLGLYSKIIYKDLLI